MSPFPPYFGRTSWPGDPEAPARGKVERSEVFDVAGGDASARSATPRSTCTAATKPPAARPPADSDPYAPNSDTQAFRIRFRSSSRANYDTNRYSDAEMLAMAQVHATLANAAATAIGDHPGDPRDWREVAGSGRRN